MLKHGIFCWFLIVLVATNCVVSLPVSNSDADMSVENETTEDNVEVLHLFQVPKYCHKGYKLDHNKKCRKIFGFKDQ